MKKLIRKSLAVISVIILCGLSAVQAKEIHAEDKDQIIVSKRIRKICAKIKKQAEILNFRL